ncbi:class III signal peptide-containing protein [Methanocaldococcus fervens]|uniref:Class III signal peptide-containing protein n=1 Tax=Methanocaldococcus fervens (strain DSM 4213 / JCM 15782 / AG86) TaxID=573064 RepID=C7P862_METFA|nr:class III signal peptide-containing protein [Methanocaldococcus fervens]ACV24744.1 Protein of unknown function DUF361 [Methanocaldococcus fervens AG86]
MKLKTKLIGLKKAQISLEFSFLFFAILLTSLVTISLYLSQNLSEDDLVINDVENAAKNAIILANSGYNGMNPNITIIYGGISWSDDKKTIYIYLSPKPYITQEIKNFVIGYIYNTTNTNKDKYNIIINP